MARKDAKAQRNKGLPQEDVKPGLRKSPFRLCAFARIEKIRRGREKKNSAPQCCGTGSEDTKAQRKNSLRLGAFARKKINISKKKSLRSLL
jgi:hypothetical protein